MIHLSRLSPFVTPASAHHCGGLVQGDKCLFRSTDLTGLLTFLPPLFLPSACPLQARTTVVEFLKEKGLFRGTLDNPMRLGLCSRWVASGMNHIRGGAAGPASWEA